MIQVTRSEGRTSAAGTPAGSARRQAGLAPPVAGGTPAPAPPEPPAAPPRETAARGERHHAPPPAPPPRQGDRGAGARRAEVLGGQCRRGLERLRIARVDLE